MQTLSPPKRHRFSQPMALLMSGLLMIPFLNACGSSQSYNSPPPPVDDTRGELLRVLLLLDNLNKDLDYLMVKKWLF